jgi:hypothetical protein
MSGGKVGETASGSHAHLDLKSGKWCCPAATEAGGIA